MELEKVDTRKPLEKRRPTAEELGESTAKSESMTKPLILTSATISAALRAELGLGFQYLDWTNAEHSPPRVFACHILYRLKKRAGNTCTTTLAKLK